MKITILLTVFVFIVTFPLQADELELLIELFGEGGYYGWSVCGIDINNDGFKDVAIGAPMYSGSIGSSQGAVYIYFGGPAMDATPDMIMRGTMEREQFGISIANAGDLNGDEAEDLIIGGNVTRDIGGAYIFFGGPLLDSIPDITTIGEERVDNYGYAVTGVGDINEDGFSDVLVGALYNDARGPRTGRAYLYYGGVDMDSIPDVIFTGLDSLDDFSCNLDGEYDINNDGSLDFIVGAVQAGWASSYIADSLVRPGEALVFYGGSILDTIPDLVVHGENPMDFFGGTVAGVQDFNNDGYDDLISGGYHYSEVESVAGRAYLYLGGDPPDSFPDMILSGRIEDETFGDVVADPGDINGDGYGDILVGASKNRDTGISTGVVYIYYGGDVLDSIADITIYGEADGDRLGWSCESLGDVNGDRLPDLAVTAPRNDEAGENFGKVYIYLGFTSGPPEVEIIEPFEGAVSACEYQNTVIKISHPYGIEDSSIEIQVNEEIYSLEDTGVSFDNDTLVFTPSIPYHHGDTILFCINNASSSVGSSIEEPICSYFIIDLLPPEIVSFSPEDGIEWHGRQPEFRFEIFEDIAGIDFDNLFITANSDTHYWGSTALYYESNEIVFSPIAGGFYLLDEEDITVCIEQLQDSPDYCDPNENSTVPFCINLNVNLFWNAELLFIQPGSIPTRLIIGQYSLATDGLDRGIDQILIPPPPGTRTDARLMLDDPLNPHVMWLNSDYRAINDTSIIWEIYTDGFGEATMTWDPCDFGEGVFLLENYFDMKAYDSYIFNMGDTLQIFFNWFPMEIYSLELQASWNMISLPIYPKDYEISSIFDISDLGVFYYNTFTNSYINPTRYPTTHGMFIFSASDTIINVTGFTINNYTLDMAGGWNQIGSVWNPDGVPFTELYDEPDGSIELGTLFRYSPDTGYELIESIEMGNGYWIFSNNRGKLSVGLE